ncbi:MAG: hypothetical protein JWQ16_3032 [Novosphingobium sp.]|nr:hypothetical protein [Novosphingobium sp.]
MVADRAVPAGEWRQHWPMLMPCVVGIMMAAVNGYSLGVIMGPLERETGWSRTEISMGPMIISVMALFAAPIVGSGIDRFGPRKVAIIGTVIYCSALAFVATASGDIMSWWTRWAILGLGTMFVLPTVWTAAINSLFSANRGKALAIALCGTGLSAAVVPVLTNAMIQWNGWRGAYIGLAMISAAIVLPLVLLFFRGATDVTAHSSKPLVPAEALPGLTRREGFRSPSFLKLAGAVLLFGITSCALTVNAVPVLISEGLDASTAAWIATLIGLGSIAGRLGGGFLLDHFNANKIAAGGSFAPVVTVVLFIAFPGSELALAAGLLILGLSAGTEVDACSYLAARHFGMRSFGALFGAINGLVLFGAGMAPIAANMVYDFTGNYHAVLISVAPLSLMAGILFLALGRYPDFTATEHPLDNPLEPRLGQAAPLPS